MDAPELKLECLKLALVQAKAENQHQSIDRVAEIATRFYTFVAGGGEAPQAKAVGRSRQQKADKADPLS